MQKREGGGQGAQGGQRKGAGRRIRWRYHEVPGLTPETPGPVASAEYCIPNYIKSIIPD